MKQAALVGVVTVFYIPQLYGHILGYSVELPHMDVSGYLVQLPNWDRYDGCSWLQDSCSVSPRVSLHSLIVYSCLGCRIQLHVETVLMGTNVYETQCYGVRNL